MMKKKEDNLSNEKSKKGCFVWLVVLTFLDKKKAAEIKVFADYSDARAEWLDQSKKRFDRGLVLVDILSQHIL